MKRYDKVKKVFDKEFPKPCDYCNYQKSCQIPCEDLTRWEKLQKKVYKALDESELL